MATTLIFSARDIEYLINHLSLEQLRIEIKNARNKLHREFDYHWQAYYEDYIKACQLAIETIEPPKPKRNNGQGQFMSIDEIKAKYALSDYVGQFIKLKKSNDKFKGLCPFHPDKKSESFFIYPDNTYHCFGCQAHGSIIDFVMNYEKLDLKSALTKLSG